jgi:Phage integrase, N-terminal SAM-like domain
MLVASDGGLREARAARGDAVAKLSRGERVARTKLTLAEYAETWVETQEGRLRPKTLRTCRDHLRLHVVPKLGRRKLSSITVDAARHPDRGRPSARLRDPERPHPHEPGDAI